MRRGSNYWYIKREDMKNGIAIRKRYKDTDEWWIYRKRESNIVNPHTQKPFATDEKELWAIIVCLGDTKYTSDKKNEKAISIVGERYTNDSDGYDLDHYLKETGRSK